MIRVLGLLAVLVLTGCAAQPADGRLVQDAPPSGGAEPVPLPADGGLVLEVRPTGAYSTAQKALAELPLVSLYADGRVISQGPQIAIFPAPALPNLQVATVPVDRVEELLAQALDAGVGQELDWGLADLADVPVTRITVVTADGEVTSAVPGLGMEDAEGGQLTAGQRAAREPVRALVDDLTGLAGATSDGYVPTAVAAVVGPEIPGGSPDDVAAWPGPTLPGDAVGPGLDVSCLVAEGADAEAVLAAAADATETTVWTADDGSRWSIALRPLLPHEEGCADLGS